MHISNFNHLNNCCRSVESAVSLHLNPRQTDTTIDDTIKNGNTLVKYANFMEERSFGIITPQQQQQKETAGNKCCDIYYEVEVNVKIIAFSFTLRLLYMRGEKSPVPFGGCVAHIFGLDILKRKIYFSC